jgi:hypothetical protein
MITETDDYGDEAVNRGRLWRIRQPSPELSKISWGSVILVECRRETAPRGQTPTKRNAPQIRCRADPPPASKRTCVGRVHGAKIVAREREVLQSWRSAPKPAAVVLEHKSDPHHGNHVVQPAAKMRTWHGRNHVRGKAADAVDSAGWPATRETASVAQPEDATNRG